MRLYDDVAQGLGDQINVARRTRRNKAGQETLLRQPLLHWVALGQATTRLSSINLQVRVYQCGADASRNRQRDDVWQEHLRTQHQAAKKARRHVVRVQSSARIFFAFESKWQQVVNGQRRFQQRIHRHRRRHGRCRRAAHSRLQGYALMHLELYPAAIAMRVPKRLCSD